MGQMTLTYDMTFAVILLSSLYESQTETQMHRCKVHPGKKTVHAHKWDYVLCSGNECSLLAYYHMEGRPGTDEHKVSSPYDEEPHPRKGGKDHRAVSPAECGDPGQWLRELAVCEEEESTDIDRTAGCFGHLMEELFVYREDIWEKNLRRMGFFLGKFIYIMDAYEDLPEDLEKGRYNPLKKIYGQENYEERMQQILCMMIAESTAEFERLPCLVDVDILRNILYDGVLESL